MASRKLCCRRSGWPPAAGNRDCHPCAASCCCANTLACNRFEISAKSSAPRPIPFPDVMSIPMFGGGDMSGGRPLFRGLFSFIGSGTCPADDEAGDEVAERPAISSDLGFRPLFFGKTGGTVADGVDRSSL